MLPDSRQSIQDLLERLSQEISDGIFPAGSRLPRSKELAKHFGVSTGTLSNAMWAAYRAGYLKEKVGLNSPWYVAGSKRPELSALLLEIRADIDKAAAVWAAAEKQVAEAKSLYLLVSARVDQALTAVNNQA